MMIEVVNSFKEWVSLTSDVQLCYAILLNGCFASFGMIAFLFIVFDEDGS